MFTEGSEAFGSKTVCQIGIIVRDTEHVPAEPAEAHDSYSDRHLNHPLLRAIQHDICKVRNLPMGAR